MKRVTLQNLKNNYQHIGFTDMTEKTKETNIVTHQTVYVADDGTEFESKSECATYERSALHAIRLLYNTLIVSTTNTDFLCGEDPDHKVDVLFLKTTEDVETVVKLMYAVCCTGQKEEDVLVLRNSVGKCPVFLGWNCDESYVWLIGSRDTMIERINSLCPSEQG